MSSQIFYSKKFLYVVFFWVALSSGCAVEAAKQKTTGAKKNDLSKSSAVSEPKNFSSQPSIKIEPNSPADSVRAFYKHLRDKKYREAMFLTNLRPAI